MREEGVWGDAIHVVICFTPKYYMTPGSLLNQVFKNYIITYNTNIDTNSNIDQFAVLRWTTVVA